MQQDIFLLFFSFYANCKKFPLLSDKNNVNTEKIFRRGIFFLFFCTFSTLLHLPPLRFHCLGGCRGWTQDSCDLGIGCQTLKPLGYISSMKEGMCLHSPGTLQTRSTILKTLPFQMKKYCTYIETRFKKILNKDAMCTENVYVSVTTSKEPSIAL